MKCSHGFPDGYCEVLSCPHVHRVTGSGGGARNTAPRVKHYTCIRCGALGASVKIERESGTRERLCRGCASLRETG